MITMNDNEIHTQMILILLEERYNTCLVFALVQTAKQHYGLIICKTRKIDTNSLSPGKE